MQTKTRAPWLKVAVDLGRRARVVCAVARTHDEQRRGLQGHAPLAPGEGMLFPFHPPRATSFHMGSVSFPIDIIFADAEGRVAKIVHGAEPGSRARWGVPVASLVVEMAGGEARALGLRHGDVIQVAGRKVGLQTYNLLRTLTEAAPGGDGGQGPDDWYQDGYYGREPAHRAPGFGGAPPTGTDRFEGHNLPPDGGDPNAMNQPDPYWEATYGRDVSTYSDTLSNDPSGESPLGGDNEPAATRMGGAYLAGRRAQTGGDGFPDRARPTWEEPKPTYDLDLKKLGPALIEAAFRAGLKWQPDPKDPAREQVAVTQQLIGTWLHSLGMDDALRSEMFDALKTEPALKAIGDAFTIGGVCDGARIEPFGHTPVLVLSRGKAPDLPGAQPQQQEPQPQQQEPPAAEGQ